MVYTCQYQSPMGDILLAADEIGLTGLWFVGQKYFAKCGRFCCRFRMVRQRHMERLPDNWLKSMAWIICLHRQSAVQ